MKILSVVEASNVNAVAKVVLDFFATATELAHPGNDVPAVDGSIVTFDRATVAEPNEFMVAVRAAGIELDVIFERRRFDLSVINALKAIADKRAPDIIVTNSVKSHFFMWRSQLWRKYPWVAFHHGYTTTDRKMRLYNRFDRFSLPKADIVVTVCEAFAGELRTAARVPRERLRVRHNSVRAMPAPAAAEVRALRQRLEISNDQPVILSIGRLSQEKAHADLIAAFNQLRTANPGLDCRLIIVGDGPERENLNAAAQAVGLNERVALTGQVQDVRPFYALADVFVLPSHSEGSPNVLLEAMAAEVPIIATAVGGVPEIVADEESALLVPPRHPSAMASAIGRLLSDRSLAHRLTRVASSLIAKNHSPETYARSLIRLYDEVLAERVARGSRQ